MIKLTVCFALLLVSCCTCGQDTTDIPPPASLDDGWSVSDLATAGYDLKRVKRLFSHLESEPHKLDGMVLVHQGKLVLEAYFNDYTQSTPHDLRSVTKSIRALLLGVALDQGLINDINAPITHYLKLPVAKKHVGEAKNSITIEHLVTMSTGLDCDDWDKKSKGQEDRVYKKKDWLQYTLDLPMLHEPGTVSKYCSMGVVLLAELMAQTHGDPIPKLAERWLFQPLNITQAQWGHTHQKPVIDSAKRLYLTPRDMAKIGQLVLNQGRWDGQQIVSSQWIHSMTRTHTQIAGVNYGYLWWQIPLQVNGRSFNLQAATGNGGQYIFVMPELDAVAVFTGSAYNSPADKLPFAILKDVLIPTLLSKQ